MRQSLDLNSVVDVPAEIAVCPYCKAALTAQCNTKTLMIGMWLPSSVIVNCTAAPEIASAEWRDWFKAHARMPYVYQLPVDLRILHWMQQNFFFKK